jgi:hypothetical protein
MIYLPPLVSRFNALALKSLETCPDLLLLCFSLSFLAKISETLATVAIITPLRKSWLRPWNHPIILKVVPILKICSTAKD